MFRQSGHSFVHAIGIVILIMPFVLCVKVSTQESSSSALAQSDPIRATSNQTQPPSNQTQPPSHHTQPPSNHTQPPSNETQDPRAQTSQKTEPDITTSPAPPVKLPNITIPFNSQVKWNDTFKKEMNNPNSDARTKYGSLLEDAYRGFPGFKNITIQGFWNGSVIVNYTAFIDAPFNQTEFRSNIEQVKTKLLNSPNVNGEYLSLALNGSLQQVLTFVDNGCNNQGLDLCAHEELCKIENSTGAATCRAICSISGNKCNNNGTCEVDFNKEFFCRCQPDSKYVYGGQYCEVRAEIMDLSKNNIIAIAVGTGGGIIVILVLVIIIVVCRQKKSIKPKRKNKTRDSDSEQSFKSMKDSEDGLHQAFKNPTPLDYNNPTFSNVHPHASRPHEAGSENLMLSSRRSLPQGQGAQIYSPMGNEYVLSQFSGMRQLGEQQNIARQRDQEQPVARQREDGIYGSRQGGQEQPVARQREDGIYGSRQGGQETEVFRQSKPPSDAQSVQFPYAQTSLLGAEYMEIDDNDSKSIMYQPTKVMRPLVEFQGEPQKRPRSGAKVYDYSQAAEPVAHPQNPSGGHFYDFDYENSNERGRRVNDPYSLQRPRVSLQKNY